MDTPTNSEALPITNCSASLFYVQCYDPFKGWDTWLTYDNEHDATTEMERRQANPVIYCDLKWRVIQKGSDSLPNDKIHP